MIIKMVARVTVNKVRNLNMLCTTGNTNIVDAVSLEIDS